MCYINGVFCFSLKSKTQQRVAVHKCSPTLQETEAKFKDCLRCIGYSRPGQLSEALSQNKIEEWDTSQGERICLMYIIP